MLKIGILDSGLGGHYALLDIKYHFPQYEYETYLDHKNAPYGDKSSEEIFELSVLGCESLLSKGCNLILIACNTISAESLKRLQRKYANKKILGCIIPTCEIAIETSQKNIGMIATRFTVDSQKYEIEIQKLSKNHNFFPLATPELAGYIENGREFNQTTLEYLDEKIDTLLQKNIDTLILGCTHYSVLCEIISKKYPKLKIIDSAKSQNIKLGGYITKHKLDCK